MHSHLKGEVGEGGGGGGADQHPGGQVGEAWSPRAEQVVGSGRQDNK